MNPRASGENKTDRVEMSLLVLRNCRWWQFHGRRRCRLVCSTVNMLSLCDGINAKSTEQEELNDEKCSEGLYCSIFELGKNASENKERNGQHKRGSDPKSSHHMRCKLPGEKRVRYCKNEDELELGDGYLQGT